MPNLRALPASEIVRDNNMLDLVIKAVIPSGPLQYVRGPVLDGALLRDEQGERFAQGKFTPVPLIIGTTSMDIPNWFPLSKRRLFQWFDEKEAMARELYDPTGRGPLLSVVVPAGTDRTMHEPARFVARQMAAAGQPVYRYRFSYVADSIRTETRGAEHSSELPYMFGTLETHYGDAVTERDRAMSRSFLNYIANFVKHGDPNGDDLPEWVTDDPDRDVILDFSAEGAPELKDDPLAARLDLMEWVAENQPRPLGIAELEKPDWTGFATVGILHFFAYPGSSQKRTTPVPIAEISWRDTFFASAGTTGRSAMAGWHAYDNRTWRISGTVGITERRMESHSDALAGMGNRDPGFNAGLMVVRRSGLLFSQTFTLSQRMNAGGGRSASLGASLMLPFSLHSALTVHTSVEFADGRRMRYDFGINPDQAERRRNLIEAGDPRLQAGDGESYTPDGGIQRAGVDATYIRVLADRWALVGFGSYGYLLGPAANSPLTRQKSNLMLGFGFGLKF